MKVKIINDINKEHTGTKGMISDYLGKIVEVVNVDFNGVYVRIDDYKEYLFDGEYEVVKD